MAIQKKTKQQIEDKNTNACWDELSQLLREHLEEQDKDNEDLQIHKIRRTQFRTPEGV